MKKSDLDENPTILEAVDNLSSMIELDLEEMELEKKEAIGDEMLRLRSSNWLDVRDQNKTMDSVKGTFRAVHNYLKYVYQKESEQLKDREMQKGLKSIITLATEAATKVETYIFAKKGLGAVKQSKEYQDLMDFYEKKIHRKIEETIEKEENWKEEWEKEEDAADIQRRGLKDLEAVTRDRDYELFFIAKEDGSKFYNKNLLRHIRLVTDFDQILAGLSESDPLLKVKLLQDKEMHQTALSIKSAIQGDLDSWIRQAGKYRDDPFAQVTYRTIMALLLACNPRNCIGHTNCKNVSAYFKDFQLNLRTSLNNVDYQSFIQNAGQESDSFYKEMVAMLHKISYHLLTYPVDESEAFALFARIMQEEESKKRGKYSSIALWNQILDSHDALQRKLKLYPSGPLFKVIDIFHEVEEEGSFDPYLQDDRPDAPYEIISNKKKIKVLRSACPTAQHTIQKATIVEEFQGLLRHMIETEQKILMINFQDRTSWKEFARSILLESFQKDAEMRKNLDVITLPKATDFYLQSNEYIKLNDAKQFKEVFLEQIKSEESCGFYFPRHLKRSDLHPFAEQAFEFIHKYFFGGKEQLSRKNRLDWIEIFYNMLIIKSLSVLEVDLLCLCAKDGVDIPSTASAGLFAFIRLIKEAAEWKEEEKDFLLKMIFLPALLIRERVVDLQPLNRIVSMLAVVSSSVDGNHGVILTELERLYGTEIWKTLSVNRLTTV